jgi:aminobenzoyl-glutamate utilization protein A
MTGKATRKPHSVTQTALSPAAYSKELEDDLRQWRRDFHRNPELKFEEFRTAARIADHLDALGYEVRVGAQVMDSGAIFDLDAESVAKAYDEVRETTRSHERLDLMKGGLTGVVGDLRMGAEPGPTVALRVDMDALPIMEAATHMHRPARDGFSSAIDHRMHACGHDGHMAIGMGVAAVMARMKPTTRGNVRLIFQPGEEGACGGAAALVAKGVADDVDALLCVHLGLGVPTGEIVTRAEFLATSKYRVTLSGMPAHVTNDPQGGRNALLAAAAAAMAIHSIAPSSQGWFSVNVGVLHAGEAQGICPSYAMMELGFWTENDVVHEYVDNRIDEILDGVAMSWGVRSEKKLIGRAPATSQDADLAELVGAAAAGVTGVRNVIPTAECRAGEDAFCLIERVRERGKKGLYMLIGSDLAGGHHAQDFDFDEQSLVHGVAVVSEALTAILSREST